MGHGIPDDLIETLLSLGVEDKDHIKNKDELIEFLKSNLSSVDEYNDEDWQSICELLSRESHILLFRGLIYADIIAWGQSHRTPVNAVFHKLNTRCWPETVFNIVRWAVSVCQYHNFDTGNYAFDGMLRSC